MVKPYLERLTIGLKPMQASTKKTIIGRLKTATTEILAHPILPGGAAVPFVDAWINSGPVIPATKLFVVAFFIYLVGDDFNRRIDAYLDKIE